MFEKISFYVDNIRRQTFKQIFYWIYNKYITKLINAIRVKIFPQCIISDKELFKTFNFKNKELLMIKKTIMKKDYRKARGEIAQYFLKKGSPSFFFSSEEKKAIINYIQSKLKNSMLKTIERAEQISSGKFKILGKKRMVKVNLHNINWQSNPINDIEWTHALNRFRLYGTDLTRAYLYTHNLKFANNIFSLIKRWIYSNPIGTPIAWASMAISLRLMAWLWIYFSLRNSNFYDADFLIDFLKSIFIQVKYLMKHCEFEYSENHLLFNLGALWMVGILFPEFKESKDWVKFSWKELQNQLKKQFRKDGFHFEQSTHYHIQVTKLYLEIMQLAQKNDIYVPEWMKDKIEKMVEAVLYLSKPNGEIPILSDGFTSFTDLNLSRDVKTVLALGAVFFNRGDFKFQNKNLTENAAWILGIEGIKKYTALVPQTPRKNDIAFKESGYFVIRTGWQKEDAYLVFDCGPLGASHVPGHGHADLLSFEFYYGGETLIVDSGTYEYEPGDWAFYFKKTRAHNTVEVDNQDQSILWKFARWVKLPQYKLNSFIIKNNIVIIDGEHYGYCNILKDRVIHRRKITFHKNPVYLIIEDVLKGEKKHNYTLFFHLAPSILLKGEKWIKMMTSKGNDCYFVPIDKDAELTIIEGRSKPIQGWWASEYGLKIPIPVIKISKKAFGKVIFKTLIVPTKKDKVV